MFDYITPEITTIIFDLGKVLLNYDWKQYLDSFGYDAHTNQVLADAMFLNDAWERGDKGGITPAQWEDLFLANAPGHAPQIHQLFEGLEGTISPFPYTDQWIQHLKQQGYRLYFLSNYSLYLHEVTRKHMGFLEEFDGGIFSYEVQCIKPNLRIYQLLLERYGIRPEEAMFFDDRPENVEAAQNLGIKGTLFTPEFAKTYLSSYCK